MAKVKVRIAVAVDRQGNWNSCGWSGCGDVGEMFQICVETIESGEARYILTADLDLPVVTEVEAEVETPPPATEAE